MDENPVQEGGGLKRIAGNLATQAGSASGIQSLLAARQRRRGWKQWLVLALWAVFVLWTA